MSLQREKNFSGKKSAALKIIKNFLIAFLETFCGISFFIHV